MPASVKDCGDHYMVSNGGSPWRVAKKGLSPEIEAQIKAMADGGQVVTADDAPVVVVTRDALPQQPGADEATLVRAVGDAQRAAIEAERARLAADAKPLGFGEFVKQSVVGDAAGAQADADVAAKALALRVAQAALAEQQLRARTDANWKAVDARTGATAREQLAPAIVNAPTDSLPHPDLGDIKNKPAGPRVIENTSEHYLVDGGDGKPPYKVIKRGLSKATQARLEAMAQQSGAIVRAAGGIDLAGPGEYTDEYGNPISIDPSMVPLEVAEATTAQDPQPTIDPTQPFNVSAQPVSGGLDDALSGLNTQNDAARQRLAELSGTGPVSLSPIVDRTPNQQRPITVPPEPVAQPSAPDEAGAPDVASLASAATAENAAQPAAPRPARPQGAVAPRVDEELNAASAAKVAADQQAAVAMAVSEAQAKIQAKWMTAIEAAQADRERRIRESRARADAYERQIAETEIDPHHYFASRPTGQNVMSAIGIMLGAYGAGLTGGPNLALEQLNRNIDRDIDAQKANLGKKQTLYSMHLARFRDDEEAYNQTRADLLAVASGQAQLTALQFGGQEAQAKAAEIKARIDQQLAALHAEMADKQQGRAIQWAQLGLERDKNSLALLLAQMKAQEAANKPNPLAVDVPVTEKSPSGREITSKRTMLASSPVAANKAREILSNADGFLEVLRQYREIAVRNPHGGFPTWTPWGDDAARAEALHGQLMSRLSLALEQGVIREQEYPLYEKMVPDITAFRAGIGPEYTVSLDALRDAIAGSSRQKVNAFLAPGQ